MNTYQFHIAESLQLAKSHNKGVKLSAKRNLLIKFGVIILFNFGYLLSFVQFFEIEFLFLHVVDFNVNFVVCSSV